MCATVSVTGSGCCRGRGAGWNATRRCATRWQWSYDLLDDDERAVLQRCSVFAGGFDLAAADRRLRRRGLDEYAVLDLLDSLVRKSLVTAEQVERPRPLRDVGDDPPVRRGATRRHRHRSSQVRDRHAALLRRAGRRPLGHLGRAPANASRSIGWTPSSPTCAPGSAGPPTRATSPPRPPSPPTPPCWPTPCSASSRSGGPRRSSPRPPPPMCLNSPASTPPPVSAAYTGAPRRLDYAQTGGRLGGRSPLRPLRSRMEQLLEAGAHFFAGRIDRYMEICAG